MSPALLLSTTAAAPELPCLLLPGVLVEVGTAYGGLAHHILATHPKVRVIAVDPFFGDYDTGDSMSNYFRGLREEFGQDKFSALWAQAMAYEGGRNFGCRYSLYNTYSEKAAALFPKRSIDMMCVGAWAAAPPSPPWPFPLQLTLTTLTPRTPFRATPLWATPCGQFH